MAHYRITEWATYQQYKDRSPPWIKLHRDMLTSRTWVTLDDANRVLALACMLVAAETDNKIPADAGYLKRRAYLHQDPDFPALVAVGFMELVSDAKDLAAEQTQAEDTGRKRPQASRTESYSEERRDREEKRRGDSREARTRIPVGWKETPELIAYAKAQGCSDPADTFERFRLHHGGKGTRHSDWTKAAQFWCRNEKNFRTGGKSQAGGSDPWAGVDV